MLESRPVVCPWTEFGARVRDGIGPHPLLPLTRSPVLPSRGVHWARHPILKEVRFLDTYF